ncbi:hypothetical protein ACM66B_003488 [Microbotryomycetes sp. NB124-2]
MDAPELSPELHLRSSSQSASDSTLVDHPASHSTAQQTSALETMNTLRDTLPQPGTSVDSNELTPRENTNALAGANGHDSVDVHRRGSWDDQQDKVKMYKSALHQYTLQHFHDFQRNVEQRSRSNSTPVKPVRNSGSVAT